VAEAAGITPAQKGARNAKPRESADIVAVAMWPGDTAETAYKTCAHMMPGAGERERKAMDQFFQRAGDKEVPRMCPSGGVV
jgi:hypothetical protein